MLSIVYRLGARLLNVTVLVNLRQYLQLDQNIQILRIA